MEEVLFGIKIDLVLKWHFKNFQNIGQTEIIGNGQQIQTPEKRPPF